MKQIFKCGFVILSFSMPFSGAFASSNCNCLNVTIVNKTDNDCNMTNKPKFTMGEGASTTLQSIAAPKEKDKPTSGHGKMCASLNSGPSVTLQYTCGSATADFV